MFEFSVALKYLIPRKKQLSVSLISLMSVGVISLVVWLVLVFLSVTEGIERGWLEKLTKLHAPVRITPTPAYYSSYYYQIDGISNASLYQCKNIAQKADAKVSEPYLPEEDGEIPTRFPLADRDSDGSLIDPVQRAYQVLSSMQKRSPDLVFQDYEVGGALMRLQMLRSEKQSAGGVGSETQSFMTQVSYIASFPDKSPYASSLVLPPRVKDLNHLFFLASHALENSREDSPSLVSSTSSARIASRLNALNGYATIQKLKTVGDFWKIPASLLPEKTPFQARGYFRDGQLTHLLLPTQSSPHAESEKVREGVLIQEKGGLFFLEASTQQRIEVSPSLPLIVGGELTFSSEIVAETLASAKKQKEIAFRVTGSLQGHRVQGEIPWENVEILQADMQTRFLSKPPEALPWLAEWKSSSGIQAILPINGEKETGVLLAKNFQEGGVMLGDRGYLSYTTATAGAIQEQRLPIFVAGFYDPGVLSIGSKCILVPKAIAHTLNSASSSFNLDKSQSNGVMVWFEDLKAAEKVKQQLQQAFAEQQIAKYWKITTFREYDFAKDLLEQFQSDKYLFTLIGVIILSVACCNIISLLVLLVNDKKPEIGVLQAMGASSRSIALIFAICGIAMGILSSLIGTGAALYTLHHIDGVVSLLSMIQGHNAFNTTFYGSSLPHELSHHAVIFVLIATPIISLCAGLVPAIKACRLRPSAILRSE